MRTLCLSMLLVFIAGSLRAGDLRDYYYHEGPLSGTLKSDRPLPIFDADPQHPWNRLFAAFYIRPRTIPAPDGAPAMIRFEGGDVIEFLAWGRTEYWSSFDVFKRVNPLLEEFLSGPEDVRAIDPLKRAVLQHDLWAVYDHLVDQNIKRNGDLPTRARRNQLCGKLALCLQRLALSPAEIAELPESYSLAIQSGRFDAGHDCQSHRNYLPAGLLTDPDNWVEVDFHQPDVHEDISDRFVTLHAQSLQGRSYYRIFYRFPRGRADLVDFLRALDEKGIDWKQAAKNGFIATGKDAPSLPVGTEVVLLQLMMSVNDRLRPVPTKIVESFQSRIYCNTNGGSEPVTNTGVGVNVLDYRLKRHLLFDGLQAGGLEREPEGMGQYRVAIDGNKATAPDWGFADKGVLFQQCVDCHMSPRLERLGVASIPSIINSGGFDAGAQLGVVHPLAKQDAGLTGERVAKFKFRHESFRRLLELLDR